MEQVSVGSVTVTRYICEHLNSFPLSVLVRVTETHDLLCSGGGVWGGHVGGCEGEGEIGMVYVYYFYLLLLFIIIYYFFKEKG